MTGTGQVSVNQSQVDEAVSLLLRSLGQMDQAQLALKRLAAAQGPYLWGDEPRMAAFGDLYASRLSKLADQCGIWAQQISGLARQLANSADALTAAQKAQAAQISAILDQMSAPAGPPPPAGPTSPAPPTGQATGYGR